MAGSQAGLKNCTKSYIITRQRIGRNLQKIMIKIDELKPYMVDLKKQFGASEVIAYPNVSNSQLSIARHYGGTKVNGKEYTYNHEDDSLIRNDVLKFMKKLTAKTPSKTRVEEAQPSLL